MIQDPAVAPPNTAQSASGAAAADRRFTWALVAIIALSVAARTAAALLLGDAVVVLPGTSDQLSYHTLATRVLEGRGFTFGQPWWPFTPADQPTAHWSYLYTLFLTLIYSVFGVHPVVARVIQAVLVGVLQPYLVYRIGVMVFQTKPPTGSAPRSPQAARWAPLLAAALMAVYGYFIYYSATLMTEPFYLTAVLLVLFLTLVWAQRPRVARIGWALAYGMALAAAVLLRQLFMLMIPFLAVWLLWQAARAGAIKRLIALLCVAFAVVAIAIVPFTLHNISRYGRFVLLNTNAGFAFFWANHPVHGTDFIDVLPDTGPSYAELIPQDLVSLDEAALDQALLQRGLGFVVEDPVRYLMLSASRIKSYFKFWPEADSGVVSNLTRVLSFGILLPLMLLGLIRSFWDRSLRHVSLLYLFIGVYTAIHLLSWALIRYRLPIDPILILFASYGAVGIAQAIHRKWPSARAAPPHVLP